MMRFLMAALAAFLFLGVTSAWGQEPPGKNVYVPPFTSAELQQALEQIVRTNNAACAMVPAAVGAMGWAGPGNALPRGVTAHAVEMANYMTMAINYYEATIALMRSLAASLPQRGYLETLD